MYVSEAWSCLSVDSAWHCYSKNETGIGFDPQKFPTRGGFLFVWFPNEEPKEREPPLKTFPSCLTLPGGGVPLIKLLGPNGTNNLFCTQENSELPIRARILCMPVKQIWRPSIFWASSRQCVCFGLFVYPESSHHPRCRVPFEIWVGGVGEKKLNELITLSLSGSSNLWVSLQTFPQQTKSIDGHDPKLFNLWLPSRFKTAWSSACFWRRQPRNFENMTLTARPSFSGILGFVLKCLVSKDVFKFASNHSIVTNDFSFSLFLFVCLCLFSSGVIHCTLLFIDPFLIYYWSIVDPILVHRWFDLYSYSAETTVERFD